MIPWMSKKWALQSFYVYFKSWMIVKLIKLGAGQMGSFEIYMWKLML